MLEAARLDVDVLVDLRAAYGEAGWCAVKYDGTKLCGDGKGSVGKGDTWIEALRALEWSVVSQAAVRERGEKHAAPWLQFVRWMLAKAGELPWSTERAS